MLHIYEQVLYAYTASRRFSDLLIILFCSFSCPNPAPQTAEPQQAEGELIHVHTHIHTYTHCICCLSFYLPSVTLFKFFRDVWKTLDSHEHLVECAEQDAQNAMHIYHLDHRLLKPFSFLRWILFWGVPKK